MGNVTVIVDPRVVVEERVEDITDDVILAITEAVSEPTRTTYSKVTEVTEEKVVVKEAKVAITKTLATLSAKLSVNNKFQQMYSLCGLCVCVYIIFTFDLLCFFFSFGKAKKENASKKKKKENHTLPYKNTNSIPVSFTIISNYTSPKHSYFFYIPRIHSFHPLSSCLIISYR